MRPISDQPLEPGAPGGHQPTVRSWWDPSIAVSGFDPRSEYAERFWLPIVGPSTLLLLRRFARGLDEHPSGFRVGVADTGRALGLGAGTGRGAPVNRTVDRACTFELARRVEVDVVEVRSHLPRLAPRQIDRLPTVLRRAHAEFLSRQAAQDLPPAA
jgi:hypothetical protein